MNGDVRLVEAMRVAVRPLPILEEPLKPVGERFMEAKALDLLFFDWRVPGEVRG